MESNEFGLYLKALREGMGLTMRELDKRSGVSHSYISQIERGERDPSTEILVKLAGHLGESPLNLMIKAGQIPESEAKSTLTPSSAFDKYIRSYLHILIGDREHPFLWDIEKVLGERINELAAKHNVESIRKITVVDENGMRDDIPEQYSDMIIEIDNIQFKYDVLQELQDIMHEFHMRFNPAYEVGARQPRPKELERIVESENLTYNNSPLADPDRQRILDMLKVLFPDRQ